MDLSQGIDVAVLIVLLWTTVSGASRGLVSQLSWAVALLLCFKFSGSLSPHVEPLITVQNEQLRHWISMLIVYLALCAASFVGAGIVGSWLVRTKLSGLDRNLGAGLGLLKGIVICMTIMYFLITVPRFRISTTRTYSAYGAAWILSHSQLILQLVPEHSIQSVDEVLQQFNQRLQPGFNELRDATSVSGEELEQGNTVAWDDLFSVSSTSNPNSKPPENSPADVQDKSSLKRILDELPAGLQGRLTSAARRLLLESSAEEQQRLLSSLDEAAPQLAEELLRDFFREQLEWAAGDRDLLQQIAGIYPDPAEVEKRAQEFLEGVPPTVRKAVVKDWHSDALGLQPDPDAATDINSRLDVRILHQLKIAGIATSELQQDLRSRLESQVGSQ
jgi:membrane protein required for colicin V production